METTTSYTRAGSAKIRLYSLQAFLLGVAFPAVAGSVDIGTNAVTTSSLLSTNYAVTQRGAHYRISSRLEWHTNAAGKAVSRKISYTTLATGLHFQDAQGNWTPADPTLSISQDGGAYGSNTQHKIYVPGSLYSDAIRCTTPDGKTLVSRPLGLAYSDGEQTIWVAELRDGPTGQLLPSGNEAIYTNICDNPDLRLDLRVLNKLSGMESDLIIRSRLPDPTAYGVSNRIEVQWWTEFLDSNAPALKTVTTPDGTASQNLDYGSMQMRQGSAFLLGQQGKRVPVSREWINIDHRSFLIEKVFLAAVSNQLASLPVREASDSKQKMRFAASGHGTIPHSRAVAHSTKNLILASENSRQTPGFVVDYDLGGSYPGDFTLQADTTYVVTNTFSVSSNLICEGGAVVKYSPGPGQISVGNDVISKTAAYRPIIFTGVDDNSVGTTVSGSTGDPTNHFYGQAALSLPGNGPWAPFSISNARFSYMSNALSSDWAEITVSDCQFLHCHSLTEDRVSLHLRNVLLYDIAHTRDPECFMDGGGDLDCPDGIFISGENVTAHDVAGFDVAGADISLTNCLFVNASFTNIDAAVNTVFLDDDTGVFQSVGGGDHYLADASTNRSSGTTAIDPALLADLRNKTTYPPVLWPNTNVTGLLSLSPQVLRDTNASSVDAGFHYAPLDYEIGVMVASNSTVTISPGTAVGLFGETGGLAYGIGLHYGSTLTCSGSATNGIWLAAYNLVQESTPSGWARNDYCMAGDIGGGGPSIINARFTQWASPASDCQFIPGFCSAPCSFQDCQFHGGRFTEYYASGNLTNCLFERVFADIEPWGSTSFNLRNCLFLGGTCYLYPYADTVAVKDNLFDRAYIESDITGFDSDYNAFVTNYSRIYPTGAHDAILADTDYVPGPFSPYYYPTNGGKLSLLIDAGSVTNAGFVGLFHYTTVTNLILGAEIPDGTTPLDIGWHQPALYTTGALIDADGNGIPDFDEDEDGDGASDATELAQGRNPSLPGAVPDTENLINLEVYTPLR